MEGHGLSEAAGGAKAAPADPEMEARKVTGDPETPRNPPDSASEDSDSGSKFPWSLSGVRVDSLVWPVTWTRKKALKHLVARLRGPFSGDTQKKAGNLPQEPGDKPKDSVPINVRPWTWEILPHVSEKHDGGALTRIMDRVAWAFTLPDARHVLLAERRRRRAESLFTRALIRFAATFAGKPAGPPPWIAENRHGENP
ncbi:MAG: hypothetical protein F4145_10835 [Boseongicola sp. SB0675_bin_26]|nr:hypothetical protein [Boseongicola sp. SB0675_bin_26]